MQDVTISSTRYHTLSLSLTGIGQNATCYHNFSVLPHTLLYIFSQCSMVWGYLQRVTTRYHQIYKNIYINSFFKKMMVTRGNASLIAQNQADLRKIW